MLVIVLISLFAFGCEVQAKSYQSIGRNRRDVQGFYNQINEASVLDHHCNQSSCATLADPTVCPGFCKENIPLIDRALAATSNCMSMCPCLSNLWNLSQVNIPIGIEGYDGVCSLSGNVTVSGANDVTFHNTLFNELYFHSFPSYTIRPRITLTYSGFSITCSPCSSSSGGSGLLSKTLGLLNLGDGGSSGSKFSANVTVTQDYKVDFVNTFFTSSLYSTGCYVTTFVELDSGVPAEYEDQVKAVVKIQLNELEFIEQVCPNYAYSVKKALHATFNSTCLESSCKET